MAGGMEFPARATPRRRRRGIGLLDATLALAVATPLALGTANWATRTVEREAVVRDARSVEEYARAARIWLAANPQGWSRDDRWDESQAYAVTPIPQTGVEAHLPDTWRAPIGHELAAFVQNTNYIVVVIAHPTAAGQAHEMPIPYGNGLERVSLVRSDENYGRRTGADWSVRFQRSCEREDSSDIVVGYCFESENTPFEFEPGDLVAIENVGSAAFGGRASCGIFLTRRPVPGCEPPDSALLRFAPFENVGTIEVPDGTFSASKVTLTANQLTLATGDAAESGAAASLDVSLDVRETLVAESLEIELLTHQAEEPLVLAAPLIEVSGPLKAETLSVHRLFTGQCDNCVQ